jgi:hypothetical protein
MNQLQKVNTNTNEGDFFVMKEQATMLIKSGFLPQAIKTPEQALAIILTGRELGIGTMAALNTINVIQGKPTVSPQLMLALIERSGQLENIEIKTDTDGVTVTMKRKGRTPHVERFGAKEANALNLMSKDNYKKQAATMFKWRAIAACARVCFPDIILGLYTPDEMGAVVNEEGEVLPHNVTEFPKALPDTQETIEVAPIDSRQALVNEVFELCGELNKANDSIKWKASVLNEYINDLFEVTDGIDALSHDSFNILIGDLKGRLEDLQQV